MNPYYEHAGITIYHGDCSEVVESFGLHWGEKLFDLLLTDPPYGIGNDGQKESNGAHGGRKAYEFRGWDAAPPPPPLLMALCALARVQIIWGGNYFSLPPTQKWLVWDKGQRINQSDGELAWTSMNGALRIFTLNRVELMLDGAVHPTQKPEVLMRWCMDQAGDPATVFDPFMGSGSTLVAAKRLGKLSVGIEREERYCEIAARRLQQEVLPLEIG
jgi:DNA modification methylase